MSHANAEPVEHPEELAVLRKEGYTMALYVAICLLAAITALTESEASHAHLSTIVWGLTVGLALAHAFAFRVSARLVGEGEISAHDLKSIGAQLAGAAGVAVLASIPLLFLAEGDEFVGVTIVLAAFVGLVGFAVARGGGASRARSLIYGGLVLATALVVIALKNALAGH